MGRLLVDSPPRHGLCGFLLAEIGRHMAPVPTNETPGLADNSLYSCCAVIYIAN